MKTNSKKQISMMLKSLGNLCFKSRKLMFIKRSHLESIVNLLSANDPTYVSHYEFLIILIIRRSKKKIINRKKILHYGRPELLIYQYRIHHANHGAMFNCSYKKLNFLHDISMPSMHLYYKNVCIMYAIT